MTAPESTPPTPLLRVVSGNPSPEELAALIAVVAAAAGSGETSPEPSAGSQWATPARLHRGAVHPGPAGSWWASGLPGS